MWALTQHSCHQVQSSRSLSSRSRLFYLQSSVHVQLEQPIRIDVSPEERRERPAVLCRQSMGPTRFRQHTLDHERIDVDQAHLEQMERKHRHLLQTLRIAMPWPSPTPKAPLFVWLRGETEGRATRVTP